MKRHCLRVTACLLLAGTVLAAFVAVAAEVGSQDDPLVTLSYLNDTFLGELLEQVDEKIEQRNEALRRELGGASAGSTGSIGTAAGEAASYVVVELQAGETLSGSEGCEVLLRSGSAVCTAEEGAAGLVDTTAGATLGNGGALEKDHLYMVLSGAGVTAADNVTLLVRGAYAMR